MERIFRYILASIIIGFLFYRCKTIQPEGYAAEIVLIEEFKLKNSTKEEIVNSYNMYK